MQLAGDTEYAALVAAYPYLPGALAQFNARYAALADPRLSGLLGPRAKLAKVARLGQLPLAELLHFLKQAVAERSGVELPLDLESHAQLQRARQEQLKLLLSDLHAGHDPQEIQRRFTGFLGDVDAEEIAEVEQALVDAGLDVSEIHRLCEVHVAVFKDAPSLYAAAEAPPGHPVQLLMAENREFEQRARRLKELLPALGSPPDEVHFVLVSAEIQQLVRDLEQIETHYRRKELQLFPYLERHGITTPPQVMWAAHDEVRALFKRLRTALNLTDLPALVDSGLPLAAKVLEMIFKEEHILLPLALGVLSAAEWDELQAGERELGYALIEPPAAPAAAVAAAAVPPASGLLPLDTGGLSLAQLNLILTCLPLELSFVDENDIVRFYSHGPQRIFPRSPAVIGRHVDNCHPANSLHAVRRILESFRGGERDVAEFFIPYNQMSVHIRYFAVRDAQGAYRGTLEVVQDVSEIRELSGERRLLDWE